MEKCIVSAFLKQFESVREIWPDVTCFSDAMQALLEGAVDYDDIEPICEEAARRADEVLRLKLVEGGIIDLAPCHCWRDSLEAAVSKLLFAHTSDIPIMPSTKDYFERLGKNADRA
jgi:hypothetical protein